MSDLPFIRRGTTLKIINKTVKSKTTTTSNGDMESSFLHTLLLAKIDQLSILGR
jgi:hypothetical protein